MRKHELTKEEVEHEERMADLGLFSSNPDHLDEEEFFRERFRRSLGLPL